MTQLPAGVSHWLQMGFELYRVNPPLVRMVAAIPVMLSDAKTDWSHAHQRRAGARPAGAVGLDFVAANGAKSFWYFALARCASIPLSLVGGYFCYRWASKLYGSRSGLLALTLWCFSPDILAHASLMTTDAAGAAIGVAAGYCFWCWLTQPTWPAAWRAGLLLALAELTKTTWLVLFLLWPVLWLIWVTRTSQFGGCRAPHLLNAQAQSAQDIPCSRARPSLTAQSCQLMMILLVALLGLNAAYSFHGSFRRLDSYGFVSRALTGRSFVGADGANRFVGTMFGALPIPLPKDYLLGIDVQKSDFENGQAAYLHGTYHRGGLWYFYLYALAVKLPLGTWALLVLAAAVTVRRDGEPATRGASGITPAPTGWIRRVAAARESLVGVSATPPTWRDEVVLLLPAVTVFTLASLHASISHLRYILPLYGFMFVWTSRVAVGHFVPPAPTAMEGGSSAPASNRGLLPLVCQGVAVGAVMWSVAASLWFYPHSLSYFNELAGGPTNGHIHLIDSNIDWGQDLLHLKRWLQRHPEATPFHLAYFGSVDPQLAGIEFSLPPKSAPASSRRQKSSYHEVGPRPGWHAISVNFLHGYPYYVWNRDGQRVWLDEPYYAYFLRFRPIAMAGYSIYIYHVSVEEANRVRRRLGVHELTAADLSGRNR